MKRHKKTIIIFIAIILLYIVGYQYDTRTRTYEDLLDIQFDSCKVYLWEFEGSSPHSIEGDISAEIYSSISKVLSEYSYEKTWDDKGIHLPKNEDYIELQFEFYENNNGNAKRKLVLTNANIIYIDDNIYYATPSAEKLLPMNDFAESIYDDIKVLIQAEK